MYLAASVGVAERGAICRTTAAARAGTPMWASLTTVGVASAGPGDRPLLWYSGSWFIEGVLLMTARGGPGYEVWWWLLQTFADPLTFGPLAKFYLRPLMNQGGWSNFSKSL